MIAHADVTATITTTPHGGNYAPRNVTVVWVENAAGGFVKTISRWSNTRTSFLLGWRSKAGDGDIDAVSGATRNDHTKNVVATWDLKDKKGVEVPDGGYRIRVELADSNASAADQNDQATFSFVKGPTPQTLTAVKSGGVTANVAFTPNTIATCNNGVLDAGETCDPPGSCPATCEKAADACMPNVLVGSAAGCTAKCVVQPVSACTSGDGCCPDGCATQGDTDCAANGGGGAGGDDGTIDSGCAAGRGGELAAVWLLAALAWAGRRRR